MGNNHTAWWGVVDGMGELVWGELGGDDGVDGEEGEEAVGAFFAVWRAKEIFVAEEGISVGGFSPGFTGWGGGSCHGVVEEWCWVRGGFW